jgi:hypothetical protein
MEATTKANLDKMKSVATEITTGPTVNLTLETGPKTRWTGRECSLGETGKSTRVTL